MFRKNKGFAHEQEVRALTYETYDGAQAILSTGVFNDLRLRRDPEKPCGMSVQVDIPILIHKIVVSPAFPTWAIKSLQKAVDAAFSPASSIEVERSVLLDKPIIRNPEAPP